MPASPRWPRSAREPPGVGGLRSDEPPGVGGVDMDSPLRSIARRRRRIPPLQRGVYIVPNLFTSGGLFAGFYSIICTLNEDYALAAWMVLLAQVCDVLDGRV